MSTALTPQTTVTEPTNLYAPSITIGMGISNGAPIGRISQAILAGATVNPTTGAWAPATGQGTLGGISFGFDTAGNVINLPSDLAADTTIAPAIATAWAAIVAVLAKINAIRKAL